MSTDEYIVVDVETTGFKPNEGHCVIEIAAEKIRGDQVIGTYHALVQSERRIDAESESVHGITNELLVLEGRAPVLVFPEFVAFTGARALIGHNVNFDLMFINAHLRRLKMPLLENQIIDTCDLARKYLIIPSYSLEKVAAYLKVPQPSAHRAEIDVATTRLVYLKLLERITARGGTVAPVPARVYSDIPPAEADAPRPTPPVEPPKPAARLF